jgi:hypothetical protein
MAATIPTVPAHADMVAITEQYGVPVAGVVIRTTDKAIAIRTPRGREIVIQRANIEEGSVVDADGKVTASF